MDGDKAGFIVKTTDIDYGQALLNLFSQLSQEFVCRLCYQDCRSRAGFERHIEQVHGNENESGHDVRFGNVIEAEIRKVKRRRV